MKTCPPAEQQAVVDEALTSVLEKMPSNGTNQVIVSHSFPQGVGLGEIPNIGTVVVRPRGQGNGYEIIDRITLAEWLGDNAILRSELAY